MRARSGFSSRAAIAVTKGVFAAAVVVAALALPASSSAQGAPAAGGADKDALIAPEALAGIVRSSAKKPVIFQVGFRVLYEQAHIPQSRYVGPGSKEEGLAELRRAASPLPRDTAIVLYCGCCPWVRCPNMQPAYKALLGLGFTNVKLLFIEKNFGADWVAKGYPVEKGAPAGD